MKFAVDDSKDEENENGDDSDGDYPIRSHSGTLVSHFSSNARGSSLGILLPTCHPPQCLDTPIHIALAFQHIHSRMLDRFPLQLQIGQCIASDALRLIRYPLALPQALRASI